MGAAGGIRTIDPRQDFHVLILSSRSGPRVEFIELGQLADGPVNCGIDVANDNTVGWAQYLTVFFLKIAEGENSVVYSIESPVIELKIIQGLDFSGRGDQIPGERDPFAVDLRDKGN